LFDHLNITTVILSLKTRLDMKQILRITLFAAVLFSFTSCVKTVETPPLPSVDPLVGTWYLYDASKLYDNTWQSFDAGIYGLLSFYKNGDAQYDDGDILMQGSWYTNYISDGYYDAYGNYYTDPHESFQASFTGGANQSLNLYFDDISFAGSNQFTGTYYTSKSIERYTFKRY
jgi:hypothetical protein